MLFRGKQAKDMNKENLSNIDYDIFSALMREKDPTDTSFINQFPEYINNYFKCFVITRNKSYSIGYVTA